MERKDCQLSRPQISRFAQIDPHLRSVLVLAFRPLLPVIALGCTDGIRTQHQPTPDKLPRAIRDVWTTRKSRAQLLTVFPPTLHYPPSRVTSNLEPRTLSDTTLNSESPQ